MRCESALCGEDRTGVSRHISMRVRGERQDAYQALAEAWVHGGHLIHQLKLQAG